MQHHDAEQVAKSGAGKNPFGYCVTIGLAAGVIWGLLRWLAVAMNMTHVPQAFLIDPWVKRSVLTQGVWQWTGFAAFLIMSIAAALLYYGLCRTLRGSVPGLLFGIVWWIIVYALTGPAIGALPPLRKVGMTSLITDLCIFAVWGLFIGYSIAYEYHDELGREPKASPA